MGVHKMIRGLYIMSGAHLIADCDAWSCDHDRRASIPRGGSTRVIEHDCRGKDRQGRSGSEIEAEMGATTTIITAR